ncbi:PLC-like phosphodiesterase [Immersiella caudata]|uniref:PLC-like phosphodiesterase n=1 Tax=Immersiella caudata TaxID=314043 RepID=A0AA40CC75_9PEZI|nr:PLC-like phosphodiesterase [Immersiella caudata]
MGAAASSEAHPIYQAAESTMGLTIRNLTITPLELVEAERLIKPVELSSEPSGFAKITARITGRSTAPPAPTATAIATSAAAAIATTKPPIPSTPIHPFSESPTSIPAPEPSTEQLRLTFAEPGTTHRYTATFPGPSPQSLTMQHISPDPTTKEFTIVYLPRASYLAIFSSARLSSWMAELPPSLPLSALSIPGTHNSPTHYTALPSVRCQAVSVREQLNNGIRFLDIRVSVPDESAGDTDLALVHSAFPISLSGTKWFHDLLAEVYAFLDENPSEGVLMSVKREGTGKGTDHLLGKYLRDRYFAGEDGKRWYTAPRIPALEEARGKIVLVRRFHLDESMQEVGFGIDGSVWPDNCADGTCGSGQIRIQDFYEVGQTEEIDKKIELARAELERAAQQACVSAGEMNVSGGPLPMFINFLSASSFFNASCWPDRIAAKINPSVIEYLCTGHGAAGKGPGQLTIGDAGTGVVVIDWVGNNGDWDIVRCIVGWNSRLQLKA